MGGIKLILWHIPQYREKRLKGKAFGTPESILMRKMILFFQGSTFNEVNHALKEMPK